MVSSVGKSGLSGTANDRKKTLGTKFRRAKWFIKKLTSDRSVGLGYIPVANLEFI